VKNVATPLKLENIDNYSIGYPSMFISVAKHSAVHQLFWRVWCISYNTIRVTSGIIVLTQIGVIKQS